ncbi:MAG: TetR/AcrR family transcriptional regulator [Burkholderiales bacterium]|nr:TetR/AcrR family transcriptional regulator [Burkholderiales bacterium]
MLQAAEAVFGEKGFVDATIDEVVRRAGVSRGTFYVYFDNKGDVFAKLMSSVVGEMFDVSVARAQGEIGARVEAGNRAFLDVFNRHRRIMRSILQVATLDAKIALALNDLRNQFAERVRRHLLVGIAEGRCHHIDAGIASYALVLMVEFFAYSWLSFGFGPKNRVLSVKTVARELSSLWCRAVYREPLLRGGKSRQR